MNYLELLRLASPEAVMTVTAIAILGVQVARPAARGTMTLTALVGLVLAGVAVALLPEQGDFASGMLVISSLGKMVKGILLVLAFFSVLLAREAVGGGGSGRLNHFGEFLALLLLSTVGLMVLVATDQLLVMFIGLELAGLSLYIMTGFDKSDVRSAEAGMKYFLFGSVASAFTLFGLSLVYGMTGATHLGEIAVALKSGNLEPLMAAGIVMTLAGLAFKVAAAPFHLWVGDTYESAPLPAAAFIASASKVAAFYLLGRLLLVGFAPVDGSAAFQGLLAGWAPVIAVISAASIVVGNLVALNQSNVRRLLAYSAVAHAGYTLIGLLAGGRAALPVVLFYTTAYAFTLIGTFAIVGFVKRTTGGESLDDFAGLRRRSPVRAACLVIFLLSLAGLPPLAGFFGKFYLFAAALRSESGLDLLWLVLLALVGSMISLVYYLAVLKAALVDPEGKHSEATPESAGGAIVVAVLALVVLGLGLFPDALLSLFAEGLR